MNVAKKNHYNPCFWTAYWNREFYNAAATKGERRDSRNQRVFSLNIKADKIVSLLTQDVHYDKHIAVSEIEAGKWRDFLKEHFPDRNEREFTLDEGDTESIFLNFEPFLSGMEATAAYQVLHQIIPKQRIDTYEERALVASFIYMQLLRGHSCLQSLVELAEIGGRPKFEVFLSIKNALSDPFFLFEQIAPVCSASWKLYSSESDAFPLCDSPILGGSNSILVALSPHLLLKIDLSNPNTELARTHATPVTQEVIEEFRIRSIGNTFREIISSDARLLSDWKESEEFRERRSLLLTDKNYNQLVASYAHGDVWKINAKANTSKDSSMG